MRSRRVLVADIIAALLFAVSAAIQLNDPDPAAWFALYLGGALVAAVGWRWMPGLLAAIAVTLIAAGWAVLIALDINEWVGFERLVGPMEMEGGPVELTREALGLAIVAGYSAFVALRWATFGPMKTLMVSTMVAMLLGCPPPSPPPPAAPGNQGEPLPPEQPEPEPEPEPEPPDEPAAGAAGAACDSAADCESGICEGEGCGPGQGVCASRSRACTRDLRPYCGCDGVTFRSSGSCPGRRFAHRGECKTSDATGRADGARCASADQCASGICEGQGCSGEVGVCVSRKRMCTNDLRPYCGCDGETFRTSGSCPGRLYAHRGECRKSR